VRWGSQQDTTRWSGFAPNQLDFPRVSRRRASIRPYRFGTRRPIRSGELIRFAVDAATKGPSDATGRRPHVCGRSNEQVFYFKGASRSYSAE
jgi:hypothetical protein